MDRSVSLNFIAKTGQFTRDIQSMQGAVGKFRSSMDAPFKELEQRIKRIGMGISALGAGMLFSMKGSTKAALDFETSMRNVNSILGASEGGYKALSNELLNMTKTIPKSANDLAQAAYQITSAGFTNAEDMKLVLKASAEAATAGITETSVAAQALVTTLNSYNIGAEEAAHVSDVLFTAVDVGQLSFEQLATQMGQFISLANASGASLEDTASVYAILTRRTGQYAESSTSVAGIMRSLLRENSTPALSKALERLGFTTAKAALDAMPLVDLLYALTDGGKASAASITSMFQDTEAMRGVLSLTSKPIEDTKNELNAFTNSAKLNGRTQEVMKEQMKAASAQLKLLKNSAEALGIKFMRGVTPALKYAAMILGTMVAVIDKIPGPIKTAMGAFFAFTGVVLAIGGAFLAWKIKIAATSLAMRLLGKGMQSLGPAGSMINRWGEGLERAGRSSRTLAGSLSGMFTRIAVMARAASGGGFAGAFIAGLTAMAARIPLVGTQLSGFIARVATASAGTGFFATTMRVVATTATFMASAIRVAATGFRMLMGAAMPVATMLFTVKSLAGAMTKPLGETAISDLTKQMLEFKGANASSVIEQAGIDVEKLGKRMRATAMGQSGWTSPVRWINALSVGSDSIVKDVDKIDKAVAQLAQSGNVDMARQLFEELQMQLLGQGRSQTAINQAFNDTREALNQVDIANKTAAQSTDLFADAQQRLRGATIDLTDKEKGLKTALEGFNTMSSAIERARTAQQTMSDGTKEAAERAKDAKKEYDDWLSKAEDRSISLARAQRQLVDVGEKIAEINKAIAEEQANPAHLQRLLAADKANTAAKKTLGDATQRVLDLTAALKIAQEPPPRTVRESEIALGRAQNAQAEALKAVTFQQEKLAFAREQGTPDEIAASERELTDAQWDYEEAVWAASDAQAYLDDLRTGGIDKDVKGIQNELNGAIDDQTSATEGANQALKDLQAVEKEDPLSEMIALRKDLEGALLDQRDATVGVTNATKDLTYVTPDHLKALDDVKTKTDNAKISANEFKDSLKNQLTDQDTWLANIQKIAEKGPPGLATALANLGIDGSRIVADLAKQSPEKMQTMFDDMNKLAITGTDQFAVYIGQGLTAGKDKAVAIAKQMVEGIAKELGISEADVKRLMGASIFAESAATPGPFSNLAPWATSGLIGGGLLGIGFGSNPTAPVAPKADGGFESHQAQIAAAGTWRVWAEPETGGESYIPHAASKRGRSTDILAQTADLFGYKLLQFADGGVMNGHTVRGSGGGGMTVSMPISIEARVAAGVDMSYASRIIGEQVEKGVRAALGELGRQVTVKAWRN